MNVSSTTKFTLYLSYGDYRGVGLLEIWFVYIWVHQNPTYLLLLKDVIIFQFDGQHVHDTLLHVHNPFWIGLIGKHLEDLYEKTNNRIYYKTYPTQLIHITFFYDTFLII